MKHIISMSISLARRKKKKKMATLNAKQTEKCSLLVNQGRITSRWSVAYPISPSDHWKWSPEPILTRRGSLHTRAKKRLVKCELLSVRSYSTPFTSSFAPRMKSGVQSWSARNCRKWPLPISLVSSVILPFTHPTAALETIFLFWNMLDLLITLILCTCCPHGLWQSSYLWFHLVLC